MMRISFSKKLKLMKEYRSYIKKSKTLLLDSNFRIDSVYRLYTVVNIPLISIPEQYRLNKKDVAKLEMSYMDEEVGKHVKLFNKIGLNGLFSEPILERVEANTYLVYYNYKYINNVNYQLAKYSIYGLLTIIGITLGIIFF